MSIEVLYIARTDAVAIRDLDDVRLLKDVTADGGARIPADTEGTVVGIWRDGAAYEVEFADPPGALATVEAADLVRIGRSVP